MVFHPLCLKKQVALQDRKTLANSITPRFSSTFSLISYNRIFELV